MEPQNSNSEYEFVQNIVIQKFNSQFGKKMKNALQNQESTILAAVILENTEIQENERKYSILSMATGSKSLPQDLLGQNFQEYLHDCHAEILARRGFQKYLIYEINQYFLKKPSILSYSSTYKKLQLKPEYKIHFYTSQLPCGDCQINPQINDLEYGFSGAKPLEYIQNLDFQANKDEQFIKGILRSKPGRTDLKFEKRSNSLSCSDKIMKWNIVGLQGNFLNLLLVPIYCESILVELAENESINQVQQGLYLDNRKLSRKINLFYVNINDKKVKITNQFQTIKPNIVPLNKIKFPLSKNLPEKNTIKPKYVNFSCIYVKNILKQSQNKQQQQQQQDVVQNFQETVIGNIGIKEGANLKKIQQNPSSALQYYSQLNKRSFQIQYQLLFKQALDSKNTPFDILNYYNIPNISNKEINFKYYKVLENLKKRLGQWTKNK